MAIKYKGVDLPSYVLINDIKDMLLPPNKPLTEKIIGRDGNYNFGNEIDNRSIEIDYTLVAEDEADLRLKARELADYFYSNEPAELIILAEPDKYYLAVIDGEVSLDEVLYIGKGTLKFLCTDPYAYNVTETSTTVTLDAVGDGSVINSGNMPVFPYITVNFTADTEEFLIAQGADRYMYFGAPRQDGQNTGTSGRVQKVNEPFNSGAALTSGTGIAVDGGTVPADANYSFSGSTMRVGAYGTVNPNGWFGPCVIRAFDDASTATDFSVTANIGMDSTDPKQRGRIEFYLLDNSNTIFGKFALNNYSLVDNPYLEARVGAGNVAPNGQLFVNYVGKVGRWKDFYGDIGIKRVKNVWTFYARNTRGGKVIDSFTYNFTDGLYAKDRQLAKVAIHMGTKYNTTNVIPTMFVNNLAVYNENQINPATEYEYAFETGDVLEIDNNTGTVLKNQVPFYNKLDPTSQFIKLDEGSNTLTFYPVANIDSPIVTYKGRWR